MGAIFELPADSAGEFAALAAAVHPAWHQAIIRLANTMQSVSDKMDLLLEGSGKNIGPRTRELIRVLVDALDMIEGDPDREDDDDREEGGDTEGSLGFLDHMTDQTRICEGGRFEPDLEDEHDGREPDDDYEPSLGSLDRQVDQLASWHFDQWQIDFEADGRLA